MSETYNWVNIDKREYLSTKEFEYEDRFDNGDFQDWEEIGAIHVLLQDKWKGDRILWLGEDGKATPDSPYQVIRDLYKQTAELDYDGAGLEMAWEVYRNASCYFKETEKCVREYISYYLDSLKKTDGFIENNEYRIDPANPYEGLFELEMMRYKYTINHTKKEYYTFGETKCLYPDGEECLLDPLPVLMAYGLKTNPGKWIGDVIGCSDERPNDYNLLSEIYI